MTITVGDLLTAVAVIVSAIAVLYQLQKDRALRRKELADKVRKSAGLLVAKVSRWQGVAHEMFDETHPIVTSADERLVAGNDVVEVRDFVWKQLWILRTSVSSRLREVQVELAFADLYGYDPRIQELFDQVMVRLQKADQSLFVRLLLDTQSDILNFAVDADEVASAALGNQLRETVANVCSEHKTRTENITTAFFAEMERLVRATDRDIADRELHFAGAESLPPLPTSDTLPEEAFVESPSDSVGRDKLDRSCG